MKVKYVFAAIVLAGIAISGVSCTSGEPYGSDDQKVPTPFTRIPFTSEEQAAIDAAKPFALDLFRTYCEISKGDNVIISPLSAILDLGMLANGATAETQSEILETLGWEASGLEDMNSYARRLMSEYKGSDNTTDVLIANGVFNNKDRLSLKLDYTEKMKSIYDAESCPFGENDLEKELSKWILDKSGGLIKDMDLGYRDALVSLLNVLSFRGFWKYPFNKELTHSDTFINSDGFESDIDYLCDKRVVEVNQNELFTCVSLPFGNGAYVITFMLPDEEKGLDTCLEDFDMEMWNILKYNDESMKINLRIPKFEVSLVSNFKESLKDLGIVRAFSSNAQLENMLGNNGSDVAVSSVMQGCSFSIDEEGVSASAATSVNLGDTAPPPLKDGGDFFLNRPFLFAITENSSGAILFMGKIGKL